MHMFRHWRRPFSYHVLPVKPSYGLISHRSLVVRVLTAASSRRIFQWHTFPDSIEWCYWWFWKSGKLTSWGRLVVSPIYLTGFWAPFPVWLGCLGFLKLLNQKKWKVPIRPSPSGVGKVATYFQWGKKLSEMKQLPCDLEDSGARNSSPIGREIDHPWRPWSLPQYHSLVKQLSSWVK